MALMTAMAVVAPVAARLASTVASVIRAAALPLGYVAVVVGATAM